MSATVGEIAHDLIAALVLRIWPRAACRWFDHHTWIGEPIHDHCKFCGLQC
jgi:hypothetical protein